MPVLGHRAALGRIAGWDAQQLRFLPDREERFAALIDAVEAALRSRTRWCSTRAAAPARSASGCSTGLPAAR